MDKSCQDLLVYQTVDVLQDILVLPYSAEIFLIEDI